MFRQILPSLLVILFFFILLFGYTKLAGPIPFSLTSVTTNKSEPFSVTGEGKSTIVPYKATVRLGVSSTGPTSEAVKNQMNLSINKVTEAIKALGIDSKDIKTENYNINPNYDYQLGSQKIVSYQANTNLVITLTDTNKANQVIDAATKNGANQVGGVNFDNSNNSKAENEARTKAVAAAKSKAEQAAKIAGFRLGKIISYQENSGGAVPRPYALDAKANASQGSPETNLNPGSNEVVINVTLGYEIF